MFKVKPGVNESEPRYKACLVAKWFLQKFGIDNGETYSPVPKFCYATCHSIHREGFTIPGQENSVCCLHKSLYRLKRVWHFWNRNFDTFIKKFWLNQSQADPCLYFRHDDDIITIVAIWVVDCLVCSSDGTLVKDFIDYLSTYFDMRCAESVDYFVGFSITRDRPTNHTMQIWFSLDVGFTI